MKLSYASVLFQLLKLFISDKPTSGPNPIVKDMILEFI